MRKGLFETGLWGPPDLERIDLDQGGDDHVVLGLAAPATPVPFGSCAWSSRSVAQRQKVSMQPFRGRYSRAVPLSGGFPCDLAWDATLKAASPYQQERRASKGLAAAIVPQDLRRKLRFRKPGRLLLFMVDISGSMGGQYMELAKRAALILLEHAYVKRDHIAMVVFRDRAAKLLVPPTNQAELVRHIMAGLLCGGLTPLAAGMGLARNTLHKARTGNPGLEMIMILISDGRANVGSRPGYESMQDEIRAGAKALRREPQLRVLFLDTTEEGKVDYSARWLSSLLGAQRFALSSLLRSGQDPAVEIARAVGILP